MSVLVPLLVMMCATLLGAFAALFLKRGSRGFTLSGLSPRRLMRNKALLAGGLLYAASVPLYLFVLRALPLSVAYPLTSMTYVWSALLARRHLDERICATKWAGMLLIAAGIAALTV